MDKPVYTFDPETAYDAHENTIKAAPVYPADFPTPFEHAWGYLAGKGEMERHTHTEKRECYFFFKGEGFAELNGVRYAVEPGSVVLIEPNTLHTVINEKDEPLLWAAYWWQK